jgi:hypothetical protein
MGSFGNEKVHSSEKKKVKSPPRSEFVISMSVFVAITAMILGYDPEKRKLVKTLATNYRFLFMFIAILGFSGYTLFYMKGDDDETERVRDATKSGLIAFIIALLAYLDLKAAPFFIVWLTSYYLQVA